MKEFLTMVCNYIKYKPIRKEIAEELENHLQESKEHYLERGMEEKIAEEMAIKQMGEAEEIGKRLNKIHKPKLNWQLLILTGILLEFGFLVSYVHQTNTCQQTAIVMIFGMLPCIAIYFLDYRKLQKYSIYLYSIATVLLLLANGRNMIRIGDFRISSSFISTILYLIAFVGFIQNRNNDDKVKISIQEKSIEIKTKYVLLILGLFSIFLLVVETSDVRSAFLLLLLYLVITTVKLWNQTKHRVKMLVKLWGSVLLISTLLFGFLLATHCNGMGMYRMNRWIASFMPEVDPNGAGWQGIEQRKIIEASNWLGKVEQVEESSIALFNAEGSNFPFIVMLANYGFLFGVLMVIMIVAFHMKLLMDAKKIKNSYGNLLMIAISCFFLMRSIGCLLMNVNLGIKADFDIPFIAGGRIELIMDMMCLALVFSVYRRKDIDIRM